MRKGSPILKGYNKHQLETALSRSPYFEGLPFIEYENKEVNWIEVCKGILSPFNNKWREFIKHQLKERENEVQIS